MKTKKLVLSLLKTSFLAFVLLVSCTEDFETINTDPVNPQEATTEGIMAGVQYFEFAEPRFLTWRGNLLFSSQFANQFSYNAEASWFPGDAYQNNQGWTNNVFDFSYQKVSLNIRNLLGTYTEAGDANGVAVTRIMMSWFYQKLTDLYGDVPYTDVIGTSLVLENPLPAYDSQSTIYRAIITDLGTQIDAIGSSTTPIDGAVGDFVYGGDPQQWRTFANTLRLRMAIRARDAFIRDGDQAFVDAAINSSLANPLIDETSQALLSKSPTALTLSFLDGGLEDVYHGFGGFGSKWGFSDRLMNMLTDTNDPRRAQMADPSENGSFIGAAIGSRTLTPRVDLAIPSVKIIGTSTTEVADILPTQVLTAAESYFLQAEAALLGYGGVAQILYQQGITASMNFWGVDAADSSTFLSDEATATLAGDTNAQLNMVWNQRWLALLTNGYEAWGLVRRTDMIPDLTDNDVFFVSAPNMGRVPRRLIYSATEAVSNERNLNTAVQNQGPDLMTTNLWWDVN